ncbi:DUF3175 domain-containing protein [Paraburkholderia silvatlantica]|nr:DUF3175 domain-containing protein [Paraburkholderia silvatlantica]
MGEVMNTSQHPSTRRKGGRPARQRHAHARVAKAQRKSAASGATNKWSKHVNETSDAMDIEAGVFRSGSAEAIARALKESSLHSRRRKGTPFQSAMSMLNFYINRAGRNLPKSRRDTLAKAKGKLREAFGRKP